MAKSKKANNKKKKQQNQAEDNTIDPTTGTTKSGKVRTKTDEEIRNQAKGDITESLNQGKSFRDLLEEGAFEKVNASRSQEMSDFLARQQGLQGEAFKTSATEEEALGAMREGMKGYNSQEVQAMREAAMNEADRNLKTAQYRAQIQAGRAGVSGGAAMAGMQDLALQNMEQKAGIERDLVVQNAQEAQARKAAFANLVRATEDARWGRTQNQAGLYGGALSNAEAAEMAASQFNAAQGTNEALARANLQLQGAGIYTSQLGTATANNMAGQNVNSQIAQNQSYMNWMSQQNQRALAAQKQIAGMTRAPSTTVNYNYPSISGVGTGSASSQAVANTKGYGYDTAADDINRRMGFTNMAQNYDRGFAG